MSEITQIRVGKHMTGIIGLKAALDEAAARCKDMPDDRISNVLLEILSKRNYIETKVKAVGSVPPREKIKAWIERAVNQTKL